MIKVWNTKTHVGLKRKENQDFYISRPDLGLWIVCDGIGGHYGGEIASRLAGTTIEKQVEKGSLLKDAVVKADEVIKKEFSSSDYNGRIPGTTVVALKITYDEWEVVWVGDSKAWLWDGSDLKLLTKDHSFVQRLVDWGEITPQEALKHPRRHHLTKALGVSSEVLDPGINKGVWKDNKMAIMLATDGLFSTDSKELDSVLKHSGSNSKAVDMMIEKSLDAGGKDNVTTTIIGWPEKSFLKRLLSISKISCFFVFMTMIFTLLFCHIKQIHASTEVPDTETLMLMCDELANRFEKRCQPLENVAIYHFQPKNSGEYKNLDSSKSVESHIHDALLKKNHYFKMLNRDWKKWKKIMDEEYSHGLLDSTTVAIVGKGHGAKHFVTGEFWNEKGVFHIRAKVCELETGQDIASEVVNSTWRSYNETFINNVLLFGLVFLSLVVIMFAAFVFLNKKRNITTEKKLKDAIDKRDARKVEELIGLSDKKEPDNILQDAKQLLKTIKGVCLEGPFENKVILASGHEQGIGRGDQWIFSLKDPRCSRSPHAWVKVDGNSVYVVPASKDYLVLINKKNTHADSLNTGDKIAIGTQTILNTTVHYDEMGNLNWVGFDVIDGPDIGKRFVMVKSKAIIGSGESSAVYISEIGGIIRWEKGRVLFQAEHNACVKLNGTEVQEFGLGDNDILEFGKIKIKVRVL